MIKKPKVFIALNFFLIVVVVIIYYDTNNHRRTNPKLDRYIRPAIGPNEAMNFLGENPLIYSIEYHDNGHTVLFSKPEGMTYDVFINGETRFYNRLE